MWVTFGWVSNLGSWLFCVCECARACMCRTWGSWLLCVYAVCTHGCGSQWVLSWWWCWGLPWVSPCEHLWYILQPLGCNNDQLPNVIWAPVLAPNLLKRDRIHFYLKDNHSKCNHKQRQKSDYRFQDRKSNPLALTHKWTQFVVLTSLGKWWYVLWGK